MQKTTLLLSFVLHAQSFAATPIAEKDLAVLIPKEYSFKIRANQANPPLPAPFGSSWLSAIKSSMEDSPAGKVFDIENNDEEWSLVSARFVPCSPLGTAPSATPLCWPEVRLIWQPLVRNFAFNGKVVPWYADDRAIHTLFDVSPKVTLPAAQQPLAESLLQKIKSGASLSPSEASQFNSLSVEAAGSYLNAILDLRSAGLPQGEYSGFDFRPEFYTAQNALAFMPKLAAFISKFAPASQGKEVTAFSLPEGRQPPLTDEWIFQAFTPQGNNLSKRNIALHSAKNGSVILNFGHSMTVSQNRDDPRIYDAIDSNAGNNATAIKEQVLVLADQNSRNIAEKKIIDRQQIMVPNTTCGSCHKFNEPRFNFHNLSYLEDRDITVSTRVKKDVSLDLDWVRKNIR